MRPVFVDALHADGCYGDRLAHLPKPRPPRLAETLRQRQTAGRVVARSDAAPALKRHQRIQSRVVDAPADRMRTTSVAAAPQGRKSDHFRARVHRSILSVQVVARAAYRTDRLFGDPSVRPFRRPHGIVGCRSGVEDSLLTCTVNPFIRHVYFTSESSKTEISCTGYEMSWRIEGRHFAFLLVPVSRFPLLLFFRNWTLA